MISKKDFCMIWDGYESSIIIDPLWQMNVICHAVAEGYVPECYCIYSMDEYEEVAYNYSMGYGFKAFYEAMERSRYFSFSDDFFAVDEPVVGGDRFISCIESDLSDFTTRIPAITEGVYYYLKEKGEEGPDVIMEHAQPADIEEF